MKIYATAIKNIRTALSELARCKAAARADIEALRRDQQGNRRPDTGPLRCSLWQAYVRDERPRARAFHLASGLLRGIPYQRIEPKCRAGSPDPSWAVWRRLEQVLTPEQAALWPVEAVRAWVAGEVVPAAAAAPAEPSRAASEAA